MGLVRGPFTIKWGDNEITDINEIDVEHEVDSEDYVTVDGRTVEVDGNYKVTATLTLLASDIPTLAALLPQNFVANGQVLSSGETVDHAEGAIDIKPDACDESIITNNLDIISCGNPAHVLRILNARTRIDGVEIDEKIQKVMVKIIGETLAGEATMQLFRQGSVSVVS